MRPKKLKDAIRAGDLEKVRELIAGGVDVAAAFSDGTTPIQLAARERQTKILRALAGAGAALEDLTRLSLEERLTLLLDAALDSGFEEDLISTDELSRWAESAIAEKMDGKLAAEISSMESDLCRAVRLGDLDLLRERIAAGDDPNEVREITYDTPLTLALREGDEEMVAVLIEAGADVNHQGFSTPLSFALPDLRLIKRLLDAGAEVELRGLDHCSALERAVRIAIEPQSAHDPLLAVRLFLETGIHPPQAESADGDLLMAASMDEAWEVFHELLPHYPADVSEYQFEAIRELDSRDEDGDRCRNWLYDVEQHAITGDRSSLAEKLMDAPPWACESYRGATTLDEALGQILLRLLGHFGEGEVSGRTHLESSKLLIEAGADLNVVAGHDELRSSTPVACAAESWQPYGTSALRLLIEAGADVDQRGLRDRTPLMHAARLAYRHGIVLQRGLEPLLEAGADPNLRDELGYTAWTVACAPLFEAEERAAQGAPAESTVENSEPVFDSLDLSDKLSERQNTSDQRQGRQARCQQVREMLEKSGAEPHKELDLRLLVASDLGAAERVRELLELGANVDSQSPAGDTALTLAARAGHRQIAKVLLEHGCQPDLGRAGRLRPLQIAIQRHDADLVRHLIDAGADLVMIALLWHRQLEEIEAKGGSEVVQMVRDALPPEFTGLQHEMDDDSEDDDLYWEALRELPRQAALGDLTRVRRFLAVEDVGVDDFDPLQRSALMAAAEAGRSEMVRELIDAGADVNLCNGIVGCPRSTPLVCAAFAASAERDHILRLLLEAGADPDQLGSDGRTALMHAVERDVGFLGRIGDFALSTRTLIDAGAKLELRDPYELTAWARARSLAQTVDLEDVAERYRAIAELLETAGAARAGQVNLELLAAVETANPRRVTELLAAGAKPDARRHDGATPLMLAAREGNLEITRQLIDAGCDVNARQWLDRGPTAVAAARQADHGELYRMLRSAGAADDKA